MGRLAAANTIGDQIAAGPLTSTTIDLITHNMMWLPRVAVYGGVVAGGSQLFLCW